MPEQKKLLWRNVDPAWTIAERLRAGARPGNVPDQAVIADAAARLDRQDAQLKAAIEILIDSVPEEKLLVRLFASGFDRMELVGLYGFDETAVIRAEAAYKSSRNGR